MPKRLSRSGGDPNRAAFKIVEHIIAKTEAPPVKKVIPISRGRRKNPAAVALGRLGGKNSAKGRMEKIPPEDRSRYAKDAARARWEKEKGDS